MTAPQSNPAEFLPPSLAELVSLVGIAATLKLSERFGGVRLYVPREVRLSADHPIARTIGREASIQLCRDRGGETLEIPRAVAYLRRVRDHVMRKQYDVKSASQLAREYGMTRRNVFYRVGKDADDGQDDLFS